VAHVVFEEAKGLKKALTVATKGLKKPLVCTTEGGARSKVGLKGVLLPLLPLPHAFPFGGIWGCLQEDGVSACCM